MFIINFILLSVLLKFVALKTTESPSVITPNAMTSAPTTQLSPTTITPATTIAPTTIKISECVLPTTTNSANGCVNVVCGELIWRNQTEESIWSHGQQCCDLSSPQLKLTNTTLYESENTYYFCCKPNITEEEFINAVISSWPTAKPTNSNYNAVMNYYYTDGAIITVRELAMFLAQVILESGGFVYKEELCSKRETGCPHVKNEGGVEGQDYYGRGYIQLTHAYNYNNASYAIFGNECLLDHPGLVASNEDLAWKTSFWYWKYNVHNNNAVQDGHFDMTTTLVNGPASKSREKRFSIYSKIYKAFNLPGDPMY